MLNNIERFRLQKGMQLTKLSELSSVSIGYLSRLESGYKKNPSYNIMKKIAKALGKTIGDVFPTH